MFLQTLQQSSPSLSGPDASHMEMLDKKWSSIIRMNKKIMELEAVNSMLKEDLENAGKGKKMDMTAVLPREPAKLTLKGHRDGVRAVKFHPVYSLIATASEDATIKVWSVKQANDIAAASLRRCSASGSECALTAGRSMFDFAFGVRRDYESGRIERTLQGHQDSVQDIDFNGSGTMLASCSADLSVKLWNFEGSDFGCLKTLQGHDHSVSAVLWLPGGDFVLSASRDKTIKLWEVASGYCVRTFSDHEQWVRGLSIHPSGLSFVSASMDQTIKQWAVKTGELQRTMRDHDHVVECVAYSNALADGFIHAQRVEEAKAAGAPLPQLNGTAASASAAASASSSSSSSAVAAAAAVPTGGGLYLASGSRDRSVRIWETATGVCVKVLQGHDNWVSGVVWHPSGRFLLTSSDDKSVRIWDISKGWKQVKKLADAHDSFVSCIAWNSNPPLLATASVDSTAKVWECR